MTDAMSQRWLSRRMWHPFKWRRFKRAVSRVTCVVVDLETTGIDPKKHAAIRVGSITVHRGLIVDSFEFGIKPHDGFEVTQEAMDINGWIGPSLDDLDPDAAVVVIKNAWENHPSKRDKVRVCGHNVAFDISFLKEMSARAGQDWNAHRGDSRVHWLSIDTAHMVLIPYWYGEPSRTGLDGICKDLGLWDDLNREEMGHKSPLNDCAATLAVLYELVWRYA